MKAGQYIRKLAEFATGEIDVEKLTQFVEERLFVLRQDPEATREKEILSTIELYLHEEEEGLRDKGEVYAHVQAVLDNILLRKLTSEANTARFSAGASKLPLVLSRTLDTEKEQTETRDLVAPK